MGSSSSKCNVLIVGLSGAGKTTLMYRLRLGIRVQDQFSATKGFNYEVLQKVYRKKKFELHMWDMPGKQELRTIWAHFYQHLRPRVLIFVVDANDRDSLDEAREELHRVIHEPEMHQSLKIVLSNVKSAKENKMSEEDIREGLGIDGPEYTANQFPLENVSVMEVSRSDIRLDRVVNTVCSQLLSL